MNLIYLDLVSSIILVVGCYLANPLKSINAKPFSILIIATICIYGLSSLIAIQNGWDHGLAAALRLSIFFTVFWFAALCLTCKVAIKLAVFVLPYLTMLSFAVFTLSVLESENTFVKEISSAWISFHILTSLSTYATISLATMAALSVFLSQLSIKNKKSNIVVNFLPAINEADRLQTILLLISFFVLFVGIFTGMTVEYLKSGKLISMDHKTILSFCTLALISLLLITNKLFGLRGRFLSRLILIAYFLISLGYLGVKVISQYVL
tara:strand:- start:168 stop:965 length:798 start_codon:yes stop_codon:yes gene_type:complete